MQVCSACVLQGQTYDHFISAGYGVVAHGMIGAQAGLHTTDSRSWRNGTGMIGLNAGSGYRPRV